MTNYEFLKDKENLATFLDKYCYSDDNPMIRWFNKTYCNNCETIEKENEQWGAQLYAYCELNNTCKFFPENKDGVPSCRDMIKMWLDLECDRKDFGI